MGISLTFLQPAFLLLLPGLLAFMIFFGVRQKSRRLFRRIFEIVVRSLVCVLLVFAFAWVIDFPLFEMDKDTGKYTFAHNPFSAPKADEVAKLMAGEDYGNLRAQQYDLVGNGFELASNR